MRSFLPASLALLAACATDPADSNPQLGVSTASSARVIRNRTVEVPIEIVRNADVVGPITIEVDGLPPGVTAEPLEIAEGETTGTLRLSSADDIALGTTAAVTLRASAGETIATSDVSLRLTDRPGSLDTTFATGGIASAHYSVQHQEWLQRVAKQPDGKIVAAGKNDTLDLVMVTRFNADGTLDKDFSDGGTYPGPLTSATIIGVMVRADGSIVVVEAGSTSVNLRVLSSSGYFVENVAIDAALLGGDFYANDMVAAPDGSFHIAGMREQTPVVLRFTPELQLDSTFDGDGIAAIDFGTVMQIMSVMRYPDGRIAVTGGAQTMTLEYAAARLHVDGSLDTSFSGDGLEHYAQSKGALMSANLLPDGRIAAVGFDGMSMQSVTLEADGSLDMTKAQPMNLVMQRKAVAVADGVLMVGATLDYSKWSVTKLDGEGRDEQFGTDGVMEVAAPSGNQHLLIDAMPFDQDRAFAVGGVVLGAVNGPAEQTLIRIWL